MVITSEKEDCRGQHGARRLRGDPNLSRNLVNEH